MKKPEVRRGRLMDLWLNIALPDLLIAPQAL